MYTLSMQLPPRQQLLICFGVCHALDTALQLINHYSSLALPLGFLVMDEIQAARALTICCAETKDKGESVLDIQLCSRSRGGSWLLSCTASAAHHQHLRIDSSAHPQMLALQSIGFKCHHRQSHKATVWNRQNGGEQKDGVCVCTVWQIL